MWAGYGPAANSFSTVRFDRYRQVVLAHADGLRVPDLPGPEELRAAFVDMDCASINLAKAERFTIRLQRDSESLSHCTGEVPDAPPAVSTFLESVRAHAEAALAAADARPREFVRASPLSASRLRMIREAGQLPVSPIEELPGVLQETLRAALQQPFWFVELEDDASSTLADEFVLLVGSDGFQIQRFRSREE